MKKIPLTQGEFALVDNEDYENLIKHRWAVFRSRNTSYAVRTLKVGEEKMSGLMHRQILKCKDDEQVDHADGNGLNNTRKNLRVATNAINAWNRKIQKNNTSGYKGVVWNKKADKWEVRIRVNGKRLNFGLYNDIREAAIMYNVVALKYHGEFAFLNTIPPQKETVLAYAA